LSVLFYFFIYLIFGIMKLNFLLLILIGSLVFNVTSAVAQDEIVTAQAPLVYQNGVLKDIGTTVSNTKALQFLNVGFFAPVGHPFTDASPSLSVGTGFFLSDTLIWNTPSGDSLFLEVTINFLPTDTVVYFDTLTISVGSGVVPFVLPLTGTGVPFLVNPLTEQNFGYVAAGDSSDITLTLTTVGAEADSVHYHFSAGTPRPSFSVTDISEQSNDTLTLNVRFKPVNRSDYVDTLFISYDGYGKTDSVPLRGSGAFVVPDAEALYFNKVAEGATDTISLFVYVAPGRGVSINPPTITPADNFTVDEESDWTPTGGGHLLVTFAPNDTFPHNATLVLSGGNFDTTYVHLNGVGALQPVIEAKPDSYDFGNVQVGDSLNSNTITVTLTDHLNQLTDPGTFTFDTPNSPFDVVAVYRDATAPLEPNVVYVILAFKPTTIGSANDQLTVHAKYADDYPIRLSGRGVSSALRGATQATAIATQEAVGATSLAVKNGNIIVSGASAGSTAKVYNLQGQLLKTQQVSAEVEVLKTAAWPKGIYVVTVDGDQQEVLKEKVVL
jgi:hypothetical protein